MRMNDGDSVASLALVSKTDDGDEEVAEELPLEEATKKK
jgi:hypothetical protein